VAPPLPLGFSGNEFHFAFALPIPIADFASNAVSLLLE